MVVIHGDDFTALGYEKDLDKQVKLPRKLLNRFERCRNQFIYGFARALQCSIGGKIYEWQNENGTSERKINEKKLKI